MIDDGATDWKVTQVWTLCVFQAKIDQFCSAHRHERWGGRQIENRRPGKLGVCYAGDCSNSSEILQSLQGEHSVSDSSQIFLASYRFQLVMGRTSLRTTGKSRTENWLRMLWSESQYLEINSMEIISSKQQYSNLNFKKKSWKVPSWGMEGDDEKLQHWQRWWRVWDVQHLEYKTGKKGKFLAAYVQNG